MKLVNKNIIIVGASQGIGAGLALQMAEGKNRIAIVARREDALKEIARQIEAKGSEALPIAADALDKTRAAEVVKEVVDSFGSIDLAILVVGGSPPLFIAKARSETIQKVMELNYHSMINYFSPLVEQMRQQAAGGQIVHINSLAGLVVMPKMGPYTAAKAACRLFLDTARAELATDKIRITVLCPGFIATEALKGIDLGPAPIMSLDKAVRRMIRAIEAEKRQIAFPFSLAAAVKISNFLPYFIKKRIYKTVMKR